MLKKDEQAPRRQGFERTVRAPWEVDRFTPMPDGMNIEPAVLGKKDISTMTAIGRQLLFTRHYHPDSVGVVFVEVEAYEASR